MRKLLLAALALCAFSTLALAQSNTSTSQTGVIVPAGLHFTYREIWNSTSDVAATHTVGGTTYTTDSLQVFGATSIQLFALADTALQITADSLQVRLAGTNSFSTAVSNGVPLGSVFKSGAIQAQDLRNTGTESWTWYDSQGSLAAGTAQPLPFAMARFKFVTAGTTAARFKNLRIWALIWWK